MLQGEKKSPNGEKTGAEHFLHVQFSPEWSAKGVCVCTCACVYTHEHVYTFVPEGIL